MTKKYCVGICINILNLFLYFQIHLCAFIIFFFFMFREHLVQGPILNIN